MESSKGIGINDIIIGSSISDNKSDVRGDGMEKKPLKNMSGPATQAYKVLKAAFSKLKYSNKNN